jgi:hypothetical protein
MKNKNVLFLIVGYLLLFAISCETDELRMTDESVIVEKPGLNYKITEGEIVDLTHIPKVKNLKGHITISESQQKNCLNFQISYLEENSAEKTQTFSDLPITIKMIQSSNKEDVIGFVEIDDFQNEFFFYLSFLQNGNGDFSLSFADKYRQYNCVGIIDNVIDESLFSTFIKNPKEAANIKRSPTQKNTAKSFVIQKTEENSAGILCKNEANSLPRTKIIITDSSLITKSTNSPTWINYALFHEIFFVSDNGPDIAANLIALNAKDVIHAVIFKDSENNNLCRTNVLSDIKMYNRKYHSGVFHNIKAYQVSTHGEWNTSFKAEDHIYVTPQDIQACWGSYSYYSIYPVETIVLTEQCYGALYNYMANAWLHAGASCYIGNTGITPEDTESFIVPFWNQVAAGRKTVSQALAIAKNQSGLSGVQTFKIYGDQNKSWPMPFIGFEAESVTPSNNIPKYVDGIYHSWNFNNWPDKPGYYGTGGMQAWPLNVHKCITQNYKNLSPEMRYQLLFPETGTYYVWVRGWANNDQENSVHIGIDHQEIPSSANINASNSPGWKWTGSRMDGQRASISISNIGQHTVNVWMRENGYRVDRVIFTKDINYHP